MIDDGLINLVLETEVSAIDPSLAIVTDGLKIPGLVVRRADTTVELEEGAELRDRRAAARGFPQQRLADPMDRGGAGAGRPVPQRRL